MTYLEQYQKQLESAQQEIAALEAWLTAEGYVNTIHDCWEKPETEPETEPES